MVTHSLDCDHFVLNTFPARYAPTQARVAASHARRWSPCRRLVLRPGQGHCACPFAAAPRHGAHNCTSITPPPALALSLARPPTYPHRLSPRRHDARPAVCRCPLALGGDGPVSGTVVWCQLADAWFPVARSLPSCLSRLGAARARLRAPCPRCPLALSAGTAGVRERTCMPA